MVVAGDHANNDMAGDDEDSWKSQFEASGAFDQIDTQIAGLGEIAAIQDLYVAHSKAAIDGKSASIQQTKTYQIRNCSASTVKVLKSYDR